MFVISLRFCIIIGRVSSYEICWEDEVNWLGSFVGPAISESRAGFGVKGGSKDCELEHKVYVVRVWRRSHKGFRLRPWFVGKDYRLPGTRNQTRPWSSLGMIKLGGIGHEIPPIVFSLIRNLLPTCGRTHRGHPSAIWRSQ